MVSVQIDELGVIPTWNPPARESTEGWDISSHYFASYSKRRKNGLQSSSTLKNDPGNLVVVVNRYLPRARALGGTPKNASTLILAHACGMHKETWEPMLSHISSLMQKSDALFSIAEVWAMEPVHHGDAGRLNSDADLIVDSMNYPVDLVEFITRRMPAEVGIINLPAHLPRHGVLGRSNVIGIGHSIGGTAIVHAALHRSEMFSSIILIEPLIANPVTNVHRPFQLVASSTAKRIDQFSSRASLVEHFKKHPIYKQWEPEVIQLFAHFGAAKSTDSDSSVVLKTSKIHESLLASDRQYYQAVWYSLRSLSPSLPVVFIYGSKSLLLPASARKLAASQPPNARVIEIDGGHLLVQENVAATAASVYGAIDYHFRKNLMKL